MNIANRLQWVIIHWTLLRLSMNHLVWRLWRLWRTINGIDNVQSVVIRLQWVIIVNIEPWYRQWTTVYEGFNFKKYSNIEVVVYWLKWYGLVQCWSWAYHKMLWKPLQVTRDHSNPCWKDGHPAWFGKIPCKNQSSQFI